MSILFIFIVAIGMAMDGFVVSLTQGMSLDKKKLVLSSIKIGGVIGLFHGIMPVGGWLLGGCFQSYVFHYEHWIEFGILMLLGLDMFKDGFKHDKKDKQDSLLLLAVATSVDTLPIGISSAFLNINIFYTSLIIGVVTCLMSISGVFIGRKIGNVLERYAQFIGGVILIIMALQSILSYIK